MELKKLVIPAPSDILPINFLLVDFIVALFSFFFLVLHVYRYNMTYVSSKNLPPNQVSIYQTSLHMKLSVLTNAGRADNDMLLQMS